MSWFDPPPLVVKPPHPALSVHAPPGLALLHALNMALWSMVCEILLLIFFLARFLVLHPARFFPAHIWLWVALTFALGALIGHALARRLEALLLSRRPPER